MFLCEKDREIRCQRNTEHAELPRRDASHLLKLHRSVAQVIISVPQDDCQQINRCPLLRLLLHILNCTVETPEADELFRRDSRIIAKDTQKLPLA